MSNESDARKVKVTSHSVSYMINAPHDYRNFGGRHNYTVN